MFDYHDATLKTVVIDWEVGRITITFQLCSEPPKTAQITMARIREFSSSRKFPWGESFFVNNVSTEDVDGEQHLQIEMQSGDLIIISGEEIIEA